MAGRATADRAVIRQLDADRYEVQEKVETVYADIYFYPLGLAILLLVAEVFLTEAPRPAARLFALVSVFRRYSYTEPWTVLVPLLVIRTTCAPDVLPKSAPPLVVTVRNSWTESRVTRRTLVKADRFC